MLRSISSDQVRLPDKDKQSICKLIGDLPEHIKTKAQLKKYIEAQKSAFPENIAETKLIRRLLENFLT